MVLLLDACDDSLLFFICQYLDVQDVSNFFASSKKLHLSRDLTQFDKLWEALCYRRWRLSSRSLVAFRSTRKLVLYETLAKNMAIPEGKFTGKTNYVFGSGIQDGLAAWLLIGHNAANANLREVASLGMNKVEIRICLQNISKTQSFKIPIKTTQANIACATSEEVKDGHLESVEFRVQAVNGELLDSQKALTQSDVLLNRYDFVLLKSLVYCPVSVESELDFLLMIEALTVNIKRCMILQSNNTFEYTDMKIPMTMLSEDKILCHYQILPRGLVLLRDKPLNEVM